MFFGGGQSASIETTALSALALIASKRHPEASRKALAWLVSKKDPRGTWYSTQATVLSLRALLAGTGQPLGGDAARRFELRVGTRSLGVLPLAPAPSASFNSEGAFKAPIDYTWSAAADDELNERLARLMSAKPNGNGK